MDFLEQLASSASPSADKKLYLFMDNANFHKGKKAKAKMVELNIEPIYNVPYQFDFNNGIEKYWRALKMRYRPKLL